MSKILKHVINKFVAIVRLLSLDSWARNTFNSLWISKLWEGIWFVLSEVHQYKTWIITNTWWHIYHMLKRKFRRPNTSSWMHTNGALVLDWELPYGRKWYLLTHFCCRNVSNHSFQFIKVRMTQSSMPLSCVLNAV